MGFVLKTIQFCTNKLYVCAVHLYYTIMPDIFHVKIFQKKMKILFFLWDWLEHFQILVGAKWSYLVGQLAWKRGRGSTVTKSKGRLQKNVPFSRH